MNAGVGFSHQVNGMAEILAVRRQTNLQKVIADVDESAAVCVAVEQYQFRA